MRICIFAESPLDKSRLSKGYQNLIYIKPALSEKNTFAQTERMNSFVNSCNNAAVRYTITDLSGGEKAINPTISNAFVCPTDIYAIRLLPIAKKHNAGIIGFDNIRLINELDLALDSVYYDIESVVKTMADYIIENKIISGSVKHNLIVRGSI